jgi:hypothetical protein
MEKDGAQHVAIFGFEPSWSPASTRDDWGQDYIAFGFDGCYFHLHFSQMVSRASYSDIKGQVFRLTLYL